MAFQMTDITPRVRVGQRSDGSFNLEVYDRPWRENTSHCIEVDIPANAASDLGKYLMLRGCT